MARIPNLLIRRVELEALPLEELGHLGVRPREHHEVEPVELRNHAVEEHVPRVIHESEEDRGVEEVGLGRDAREEHPPLDLILAHLAASQPERRRDVRGDADHAGLGPLAGRGARHHRAPRATFEPARARSDRKALPSSRKKRKENDDTTE
jgi:hypothetical protein